MKAATETKQKDSSASAGAGQSKGGVDLSGSLAKFLYQQVPKAQAGTLDRSKPLYLDFGLSDAADTSVYLAKGYSAVAVDAFCLPRTNDLPVR
jgi:hypothetical protein